MAAAPNPPSETTGDFEPPPSAAVAIQNRKAVTWNPSLKQREGKTAEIRLFPIRLQVTAHLSVVKVIKEIFTRFIATDPSFYIVSRTDPNVIIRTADEFGALSNEKIRELFPGIVTRGQTTLRFSMAASMDISRLKKSSYGYYNYANKHIWISDDLFQSNDIRNIGFIIRKDVNRTDRQIFKNELMGALKIFPLTSEDKQRLSEAKDCLHFPDNIPTIDIRFTKTISVLATTGRVSTSALTIHCDSVHVNFVNKLLTRYYEESDTNEKFVPHSMLNGRDPDYIQAYRNAIVFQNQFLAAARVLPVIGLHPKAMAATIQIGEDEPSQVLTYILQYPYFSSIEATQASESIGKYLFITTAEHFDEAKRFIIETLPKIWQQIGDTFLEELPISVRCPRLTNSNLRDESTKRTVAMLSKQPPDDATITSKWSSPPKMNKLPTSVSVNYSEANFPTLQSKSKQRKKGDNETTSKTSRPNEMQGQPMEASSTHSKSTTASAGTAFTKDDCTSLFTTLTESIFDEFNSKMLVMMEQQNKQAAIREKQQAIDAEKREDIRAARQTADIANMMQAFALMLQAPPPQQPRTKKRKKDKRKKPAPTATEMETDYTSDPPMETENENESDDGDEEYPFSDPASNPNCARSTSSASISSDSNSSSTSSDSTASTYNIYDQNGMRRTEENNNLLPTKPKDPAPPAIIAGVVAAQKRDPTDEYNDQYTGQGTDDEYQWNGSDIYAETPPKATKPSKISPRSTSPSPGRGRGGRGGRGGRSAGIVSSKPSHTASVATVLDGTDQSISTVESDTTQGTSPAPKAIPDSPPRESNIQQATTNHASPISRHRQRRYAPSDVAIDHAINSETARKAQIVARTPASVLRPPKEMPWQVVPTSSKNSKRKANESPSKLDALPSIRKSTLRGPTPKKLFTKPATPTEEAPARKK